MTGLGKPYPFFFAAFPVLGLAIENRGKVTFAEVAAPFLLAIGCTALVLWALRRLLGDGRRAALVTTLGLIAFFAYGHLFGLIELVYLFDATGEWAARLRRDAVVAPLWLALFAALIGLVVRRGPEGFEGLSLFFAGTGVALVGILGVRVATSLWQSPRAFTVEEPAAFERFQENWRRLPEVSASAPAGELPNVYYLVLDGYTSGDILDKEFGHDNSDFEDRLTERGFFVASQSRSNYPITFLSLASSLNMFLLDDLAEALGPRGTARRPAHDVVDDHRIQRLFEGLGYRTVHLSSGWGPTMHNPVADEDLRCGWESELVTVLANTTLLRPVSNALFSQQVRQRIECTFDRLAELDGRTEQPFYAFAHLIAPHPPYLFGPEGEARDAEAHDLVNWLPRSGYVGQLRYVNRRLEDLIDRILSDERPAVIILHGDHGSAMSGPTGGDVGEVTEPTPLMRERTAIFHALYLPERCRDRLYPSITPVNSFRLLFSCHFGADLPLLEDKVYFSGYNRPYLLRDATDLFDSAPDADPLPEEGPLPEQTDAPAS